jgi:hypothetical protein
LSIPLQHGLWLLRRLRPLSCTLAFSRPHFGVKPCQSSSVPPEPVLAIRSCLLYAGRLWSSFSAVQQQKEPPGIVPHLEGEEMRPTALSVWTKCFSHLHFSILTTLQAEVSLVSIDCRGSTSIRLAPDMQHIVRGLHTSKNAVLRRMPLSPYIAIQMQSYGQHVRS